MDKIVEMNTALKFATLCRSKCRHKDSRIASRQTTRVEAGVLEFLDAGSTPVVSILRNQMISMSVKILDIQGFGTFFMSMNLMKCHLNIVKI